VIQEHQLKSMLTSDVVRQRKSIDTTIRQLLSDLRSFCLLTASYPSIDVHHISEFLKSVI
jgi:hypothetical protein